MNSMRRQARESEIAGWFRTRSGLWAPQSCAVTYPTFIDLFCGCGGFSLGFIVAGWECVCAVDDDPDALTTYWLNLCDESRSRWIGSTERRGRLLTDLQRQMEEAARRGISEDLRPGWIHAHPEYPPCRTLMLADLRELSGEEILRAAGVDSVDCVIGGPPCQGFSMAGRRQIHDPRNSLVFEFARLAHEMNPRVFVMENVPGMLSMVTPSGIPVVEALRGVFEDYGFLSAVQGLDKFVQESTEPLLVGGRKPTRADEEKARARQLSLF